MKIKIEKDRKGLNMLDFVIFAIVISSIISLFQPHDSTDFGKKRSDIGLYIDNATGCHYIKCGVFGQAMPRLDENGKHICGGWDYEYELRAKNARK